MPHRIIRRPTAPTAPTKNSTGPWRVGVRRARRRARSAVALGSAGAHPRIPGRAGGGNAQRGGAPAPARIPPRRGPQPSVPPARAGTPRPVGYGRARRRLRGAPDPGTAWPRATLQARPVAGIHARNNSAVINAPALRHTPGIPALRSTARVPARAGRGRGPARTRDRPGPWTETLGFVRARRTPGILHGRVMGSRPDPRGIPFPRPGPPAGIGTVESTARRRGAQGNTRVYGARRGQVLFFRRTAGPRRFPGRRPAYWRPGSRGKNLNSTAANNISGGGKCG